MQRSFAVSLLVGALLFSGAANAQHQSGGSAGSASSTSPDRTVTAAATVQSTDMGGVVNLGACSSSCTLTIPAISSSVLASGMSVSYYNQLGSGATWSLSSTPAINGLPSTSIPAGSGGTLVSNGVSLDWQPGIAPSGVTAGSCIAGNTTVNALGQVTGQTGCGASAGSWTPADCSGQSLTFTGVNVSYSVAGNLVYVYGTLTYPSTSSTSNACISGLPVAVPNQAYAAASGLGIGVQTAYPVAVQNTSEFKFETVGGAAVEDTTLSTHTLLFTLIYPAS